MLKTGTSPYFSSVFSAGCVALPNVNFTLVWASMPSDRIKKAFEPKIGSHLSYCVRARLGTVDTLQIKNRYVTSREETALHSQRLDTSIADAEF
jgi:hypothetical protein